MLFRQLFEPRSCTYSYLLADADTREAVLIDPVLETVSRDVALIQELDLTLLTTLETHVHADHVTGAWLIARKLGSAMALSARSGAQGADRGLEDGDSVTYGRPVLEVRATPGHTAGCVTYVAHAAGMAFTGDALLVRGAGRTDFQQGDAALLYRSVTGRILALPEGFRLYPGHDYRGHTVTTVAEEKRHNPRLGGEMAQSDFVHYMKNLRLPHPKQLDAAVPANMRCGAPADGRPPAEPTWAPLTFTVAGYWELRPEWLEEHRSEVTVVDVRPESEVRGPMGRIPGAIPITLDELPERVSELPAGRPVVAVCRAGGRSAQACVLLKGAGVTEAASLAGGLIRWIAEGFPVEGATR